MEQKLKKTIRIIVITFLMYCVYHFITNGFRPTYLDCGKIISKSNDVVPIKHGSRTVLYLNVQFNKSGFYSVECDPSTYFSKQIGDNVCFNLDQKISNWFIIRNILGFGFLIIVCVLILGYFIVYLLPEI